MELLLRPRSARNFNFFWFTLEQHLLITFGCSKLYGFVVSLNVMIYLKVWLYIWLYCMLEYRGD